MTILDSLIRKKKLARARHMQELEVALTTRGHAVQECSVAGREYADILRYLWLQLETRDPLSLQLLVAARGEEARCTQRLAKAEEAHQGACERVAQLEGRIARLDKDVEKLEERRAEQRRITAREHQAQEALRLDEWVLGRHGRGELT